MYVCITLEFTYPPPSKDVCFLSHNICFCMAWHGGGYSRSCWRKPLDGRCHRAETVTVSDTGHGKRRVTSLWEQLQRSSSNSTPLLGIQSRPIGSAVQSGDAARFGTPYCSSYDGWKTTAANSPSWQAVCRSAVLKFVHLLVCLTTGPKPLPKRALHLVRSRASSFKWEYPLLSSRSSSSFLCLLPRLPVTSIPPFIFPSINRCRRQFLRKMWPNQVAFRLLISCRIFLCSLTLSNTSSFGQKYALFYGHRSSRRTVLSISSLSLILSHLIPQLQSLF